MQLSVGVSVCLTKLWIDFYKHTESTYRVDRLCIKDKWIRFCALPPTESGPGEIMDPQIPVDFDLMNLAC